MNRTDPTSVSLGRRLRHAEAETIALRRELDELKKSMPSSSSMRDVEMASKAFKAQKREAQRLLADPNASLEQLNAIDPSTLSLAHQEQLRMNKNSLMFQQMEPMQLQFDEAAQARFNNWRAKSVPSPLQQQDFATGNLWPQAETPFQKWDRRSKSPAGRKWNEQQLRAEYDRNFMRAQAERGQSKTEPKGKNFGGVKSLSKE